jgi:PKD repeat protein
MKKNLLTLGISLLSVIPLTKTFAQVPVANFSINPNPVCAGANVVNITDMSTNAPTAWSYTLTGAAPATSTVQNPAVTYPAAGMYSITLVAQNGSGFSLPVTKTISVRPSPAAFINPAFQSMCFGAGPLVFAVSTVGPPGSLTYSWTTGATTASISVSPSVTTNYTCVISNTVGCSVVRTATAMVKPNPTVTAVSNQSIICSGQTASLTAGGAATYSWSTGATTTVIAVSPTVTTSYTVTGTSAGGCAKSITITQLVSACTNVGQLAAQNSEFMVYPNPSRGEFIVSVGTEQTSAYIEVYNGLGQLIRKDVMTGIHTKIDLSQHPNGFYQVRVMENGKQLYTSKMIKE